MSLKITKASDELRVERLNLCIYGAPGLGKTTLGFTADEPLTLDFDNGAHRAINRKDIVPVTTWADAAAISEEDVAPYKTIVLDTAGRALDILSVDIIKSNPKMGRAGGALTLPGYGELKVRFSAYLKLLNSFGKDVVLIAHMDEQRNGDDVIERLDAQGSSKGEIYKSVDAMGRIFIRNNKRILDFSPREGSFGKNPGQFGELEIPHPAANPRFLGETIRAIKDKLNAMSAEQTAHQAVAEEWATAIRDMETADDFNRYLDEIKRAPEQVKLMFFQAAKGRGLVADKKTHRYVEANHAIVA